MQRWIVTGVSGCGRVELFEELAEYSRSIGRHIIVHNIGTLIREECERNRITFTDRRVLDLDSDLLKILRSSALKEAMIRAQRERDAEFHFVGTHATFRWKNRLIPGISFSDLAEFHPDGFINVVDNVRKVVESNSENPRWASGEAPDSEETQHWMIEEEFVAEFLADALGKPVYIIAREHRISNLADLFYTSKKKIYLSYPITQVELDNPALLEQIQGPILGQLESMFVVFNPLTIEDMSLARSDLPTSSKDGDELPISLHELTSKAKDIIKARTVARDFQFIDQADAVVVFYLTDKVSAGVLAEVFYAHRTQKPVYMVFPYARSPFIEDAATYIEADLPSLMGRLEEFARE